MESFTYVCSRLLVCHAPRPVAEPDERTGPPAAGASPERVTTCDRARTRCRRQSHTCPSQSVPSQGYQFCESLATVVSLNSTHSKISQPQCSNRHGSGAVANELVTARLMSPVRKRRRWRLTPVYCSDVYDHHQSASASQRTRFAGQH